MFPIFEWLVSRIFVNTTAKKAAYAALNSGTYLTVDYFFDFVLYYFMIRQFGALYGGGTVMLIGIVIDYYMLRLYLSRNAVRDDDWFGLEEVKKFRDYEGENKFRRWLSHTLRKGNFIALFIVAFYSNPCLATIYMRHTSRRTDRIRLKDWLVFGLSLSIEILWIFIIKGAVLLERAAWK